MTLYFKKEVIDLDNATELDVDETVLGSRRRIYFNQQPPVTMRDEVARNKISSLAFVTEHALSDMHAAELNYTEALYFESLPDQASRDSWSSRGTDIIKKVNGHNVLRTDLDVLLQVYRNNRKTFLSYVQEMVNLMVSYNLLDRNTIYNDGLDQPDYTKGNYRPVISFKLRANDRELCIFTDGVINFAHGHYIYRLDDGVLLYQRGKGEPHGAQNYSGSYISDGPNRTSSRRKSIAETAANGLERVHRAAIRATRNATRTTCAQPQLA